MGCRVCGCGIEIFRDVDGLQLWWINGAVPLYFFQLYWMYWEYLCFDCLCWARKAGAEWDGKIKWRITDFVNSGTTAKAQQA